jgi:hypothetical protein
MSRKKEINELITFQRRRLHELKKQQAIYGYRADPSIAIEIEDLEVNLEALEAELAALEDDTPQNSPSLPPQAALIGSRSEIDKAALRDLIVRRHSLEQVRTLCEDCGVDYEELGQTAKEPLVRELVRELDRRGHLAWLAEKLQRE